MSEGVKILLYFAGATAISVLFAPAAIAVLRKLKAGQTVLGYVTQHEHKSGTPTMGGIIFLLPVLIFSLVEMTAFSLVAMALTFGYAVLGFLDDFIKIRFARNLGLKPYQKIIGQLGLAGIAAYFVYASPYIGTEIFLPLGGGFGEMSWGIIPFVIFVFIATTNSVNLTDGLDGLAGFTSLGAFLCYTLLFYLTYTDAVAAGDVAYAAQIGSLAAFCATICGGLAGYLIFNSNPARVMMGDTGSLGLGAAVAVAAVFSRTELLLPVVGIMFVWSSISVILQVSVFKLTAKRVFLMSPFHHHLEMKGWSEARVCTLYFVITLVAGALTIVLARAV